MELILSGQKMRLDFILLFFELKLTSEFEGKNSAQLHKTQDYGIHDTLYNFINLIRSQIMYDYDVKYAKKCKYLELIITFFPHYLNNI